MNHNNHTITLISSLLETPLGTMIAIANEQVLYLLEFVDGREIDHKHGICDKKNEPLKIVTQPKKR